MNYKDIALSFSLEQICNDLLSNCNLISKNMLDEALQDIRGDVQTPDADETKSIVCRAVTEAWGKVKFQCQRYLTTGRSVDDNSLERLASYGPVKMYYKILDSSLYPGIAYTAFTSSDLMEVEYSSPTVNVTCDSTQDLIIAVPADTSFDAYDSAGNALVQDGLCKSSSVTLYTGGYRVNGVYYDEFRFTGLTKISITFDDEAFSMQYETLKLHLVIPNFNLGVTDALKSAIHKFMADYVTYRFLRDLYPDKSDKYREDCGVDQDSITKCLNSRERLYMRRASWL